MDDAKLSVFSVPENILQPFFTASNLSTIDKALEHLIEIAKAADGRSDLASKSIITTVLELCQNFSYPSNRDLLLLSLKLLRNLCAGEIRNQNLFIEQNGVDVVSSIFSSVRLSSDSDYEIIRMGVQVLANISLTGEKHQHAVWDRFFPLKFVEMARIPSREICDPLCMVIYTCCEGCYELFEELCSDQGLSILAEILRNASAVGFREDWLKLLISRTCLEESHFSQLFSKLCPVYASGNSGDTMPKVECFVPEQAFLLNILSEILNERIKDIIVSNDFAVWVLGIFKNAVGVVDFVSRGKSGLPTGSTAVDVLGYSLTILRDICASDGPQGFKEEGSVDVVELLLSLGLLDLLLGLLHELEPPAIIRKAMKQDEKKEGTLYSPGENQEGTPYSPGENQEGTTCSRKLSPYKGFQRDLVAVIGNFVYKRKHVQDEIRQRNAILLLLQQCVHDEDNPFLREWGIWSVRNLLEGNVENQRIVSELELQGSVDVPEIAGLGLRVEVDQKTRRAKLVNV